MVVVAVAVVVDLVVVGMCVSWRFLVVVVVVVVFCVVGRCGWWWGCGGVMVGP